MPALGRPEEAQAFVDARLAEGSDFLKVLYDDLAAFGFKPPLPMPSREALEAVVRAAHRRGRLAVVHVGTEKQAREAIEAGADGLAHLFTYETAGETVGEDFGRLVAKHHAFVIPTLSLLHGVCGQPGGGALAADERLKPYLFPDFQRALLRVWAPPKRSCVGTAAALRQLAASGAPILAGTDAPVPGTTFGATLHGELALLVEDGLTPIAALRAATSAPAKAFRLADRGRIRKGLRADLVLVEGDPTRDILRTRAIVTVWKMGVAVERTAS
jgi:imidazolonepropionase-like amidohydrolase